MDVLSIQYASLLMKDLLTCIPGYCHGLHAASLRAGKVLVVWQDGETTTAASPPISCVCSATVLSTL